MVSEPQVTATIIGANNVVQNAGQRILMVGQLLPAGSASSGVLQQDIPLNSENSLFGQGSMLSSMVKAIRSVNSITPVDVIPLADNGSAVDATATITITGSLGGFVDVTIYIGGKAYTVTTSLTTLTPTLLGDEFETLINADSDGLATCSNAAGVLTLTAKNGGTVANDISVSTESNTDGSGFTLTVTSGFNSGAVDPVFTNVFDTAGDTRYQTIIWPYPGDADVVADFLDARFNLTNAVRDGIGITGAMEIAANADTVAAVLNSQSLVFFFDDPVSEDFYKGPAISGYIPDRIAKFGGIRALRLTEGANIAPYVISSFGARDAFGGPALASKPYFNTPIPGLPVVETGRGYTQAEIKTCNDDGASVMGNNASANSIICGNIVTTYQTDSAGNPDISFKYLNYVDTASGVREYFFNNLKSRFAQSRLTNGDVIAGRDQANSETIAAYCEKLYQDLSGPDFVLVEDGEAAIKFYKENLSVTLDLANGRATITMVVPIVTQLREILATIQISFSTDE